ARLRATARCTKASSDQTLLPLRRRSAAPIRAERGTASKSNDAPLPALQRMSASRNTKRRSRPRFPEVTDGLALDPAHRRPTALGRRPGGQCASTTTVKGSTATETELKRRDAIVA